MAYRVIVYLLSIGFLVAICTEASAGPLESIQDTRIRSYSYDKVMEGAPGLKIPSRIIYKEALELIEKGDWREGKEWLLLSASLSGDYPDPMFTLAKNEFLRFDPDFLPHLIEAFMRLSVNFHVQSFVIANAALFATVVAIGMLLLVLMQLLAKYWPLIEHSIRERCSNKFILPPSIWLGIILLIALLSMRAGIALYIPILLLFVWTSLRAKERVVVLGLVLFVSALSFLAHYSNVLVPPMDAGSTTRRLSLINERGADEELLQLISQVEDPAYRCERDYALGTLLYRLEILPEARDFLLSSISENGEFAPAYINLGNVYFKEGDFDKALAGYQNAISVEPENALAHYNLGQTYIKMMLFAQSSTALKRANELHIENYQTANPSTKFRNLTIYEEGFSTGTLWRLAYREGREREKILFSEILRPWLLFPFHRLWILLLSGAFVSIIIGLTVPQSKRVFRCDNCERPACHACADDELGIRLCRDCTDVVEGLSSVKVMEALLRHRRQKILKDFSSRVKRRMLIIPGAAHIRFDRAFAGAFYISLSIIAVMFLIWRGPYFKEPSALMDAEPLWKTAVPIACLLYCLLASLTRKATQESRPYWILPSELREVEKKQSRKKTPVKTDEYPWETVDVM
jgi:tetratricopeptide (TPR) repeat protein